MQRYVVSKGLGANVIRAVFQNKKIKYYRIGNKERYDGSNLEDKGLNIKKIESYIQKSKHLKNIKRFIKEQNETTH